MTTAPSIIAGIRWGRLVLGVCITTVLALSVHAVMLQLLHVPYPSAVLDSALPDVVNGSVMIWAAIWLYDCLRMRWQGRSAMLRVATLFVLLACLNETLRGAFMNGYCSTQSSARWLIALLLTLHGIIYNALVTGLAVGISFFRQKGVRLVGGVAAASLLTFAALPALAMMDSAISELVAHWMPAGGWCKLPYGMDVLVPAYLTFLEAVVACFACAALVWRYLPEPVLGRMAAFVLLILALKRQLLMSFLYAMFTPGPAVTALLSMGQFSLEAAALGALTVLSWRYAQPASR